MIEGISQVSQAEQPNSINHDSASFVIYLGRKIVLLVKEANKTALFIFHTIEELFLTFGDTLGNAGYSLSAELFSSHTRKPIIRTTSPSPTPWQTFKARIRQNKNFSKAVAQIVQKKLPVPKASLHSAISSGGNTCYIASTLQALRFIPSFRKRLQSKEMKVSLLGQEMLRLFTILDGTKKIKGRTLTRDEITSFREVAKSEGWQPDDGIYAEQDTEEFCSFLFDRLGFATFTYRHKISYDFPVPLRAFEKNDFCTTYLSLGLEEELDNKELQDIATNRKVVERIEKKEISIDISAALDESTSEELLEKVERIQEVEKLDTLHSIQLHANDIPHILPIHLKRYNNRLEKLKTKILPSEIFDFSLVDTPDLKARYKLVSMTIHDGESPAGGHYRTYIPTIDHAKKSYIEYSDACTALRNDNEAVEADISHNGLLHFYEFVGIVKF